MCEQDDKVIYRGIIPYTWLRHPGGSWSMASVHGDSMVAGFMAGWMEKREYGHAFRLGVAAGSASAFSENLATGEEIRRLYGCVGSRAVSG